MLRVPEDYAVAVMSAAGKPGTPDQLPEVLREREVASGRKPLIEPI
jgi:hypothetical protein